MAVLVEDQDLQLLFPHKYSRSRRLAPLWLALLACTCICFAFAPSTCVSVLVYLCNCRCVFMYLCIFVFIYLYLSVLVFVCSTLLAASTCSCPPWWSLTSPGVATPWTLAVNHQIPKSVLTTLPASCCFQNQNAPKKKQQIVPPASVKLLQIVFFGLFNALHYN